jgi:chromosome segregation ATPase
MTLDGLPQQLEEFLDRARAALGQEITAAKHAVTAANAEKTSAQNALANLRTECTVAQDQLATVTADLKRLSDLVGAHHEIATAKKAVQKLATEKSALEASIAALSKEQTQRQAKVNALGDEVRRLLAIQSESESVVADLRMRLRSVQIGQVSP